MLVVVVEPLILVLVVEEAEEVFLPSLVVLVVLAL